MPGGLILLAGPTASGKSTLALRLARRLDDAVIVNADSMQVYRELRIITGRPSIADEARVPHRLYGVIPAAERFSVGAWRTRVGAEIETANSVGRTAILVGGTGLYFRALLEGLAPIPRTPDAVRTRVRQRYAALGHEAFRAELAKSDSVSAARLTDPQRLIRATEVLEATGIALPAWQSGPREGALAPPPIAKIVLAPPRAEVYERCDRRHLHVVASGGLDEAAEIRARGLDPSLPAMRALGLPDLLRHLRGDISLDEAVAGGQRAIRHYAKRQYTWFRHQAADWNTLEVGGSDVDASAVVDMIAAG